MYILIAVDGSLSLEDIDNMKSFSIVDNNQNSTSSAFSAMAQAAEENHYWIDADSVIELSSKGGDQQWLEGFWDMLKKVEPYGYSDLVNKRIKAHVETE